MAAARFALCKLRPTTPEMTRTGTIGSICMSHRALRALRCLIPRSRATRAGVGLKVSVCISADRQSTAVHRSMVVRLSMPFAAHRPARDSSWCAKSIPGTLLRG